MRLLLLWLIAFNSYAWNWHDLWVTKDQQAQKLMVEKQYQHAQSLFQQPDWQASAAYRAKDYKQAATGFAALNNELGFYNQGNALAYLGQYEQALKAYDQALAINPENKDAIFNRKLIADLLKQQQKQQKQDDKSQQQKQKQQQEKQDKSSDQQQQNNQSGQNSEQQQKNQQDEQQKQKEAQQQKEEQQKEQQKKEQQAKDQQQQNKQDEQGKKPEKAQQSVADQEKQQAKEQWLRLIPDDPGGLLREKFLRDHIRRQRGWYQ